MKTCPRCGKEIVRSPKWSHKQFEERIYCSHNCAEHVKAITGEKSRIFKELWQNDKEYAEKTRIALGSDERKRMIGESQAKRWRDPETIRKHDEASKNPEYVKRMSEVLRDPAVKKRRYEALRKVQLTREYGKRQSARSIAMWNTPEIRKRIVASMPRGENHPQWTGGSRDGYCSLFKVMREPGRTAFNNRCVACGTETNKSGRKHSAHHPTYDKYQGCRPVDYKLVVVPLCDSCHAKSNARMKREEWMEFVKGIIDAEYLGNKCFYNESLFLIPFRPRKVLDITYLGLTRKKKVAYY
jgi:hypothetical protein